MDNLKSWVSDTSAETPLMIYPGKVSKLYEPLGTCLIIGSWNYPITTVLIPFVTAVGAGNTVIIKPSECAPETAKVLEKIITEACDTSCYIVVQGAKDTGV